MYRPDEFTSHSPPQYVDIYTWPDCTLEELALELAASKPSILPEPAVGTRLAFQLVFPDLRNASIASDSQPRFAVKDLGSFVIGEGGSRIAVSDDVEMEGALLDSDKDKTLSDARFVVGDYISCAILPPLPNGSVAPASSALGELAVKSGEGRGIHRRFSGRENSFGRGAPRGTRGGWSGNVGGGFPMGDWKRGERLPDGRGGRTRGRVQR